MTRFWVEIIPFVEGDTNGYSGAKEIAEIIRKSNNNIVNIRTCTDEIKTSIWDFMSPISVQNFIKNRAKRSIKEHKEALLFFNIKPESTIRTLGLSQKKIVSIICEFLQYQVISFDYYGLSPNSEKLLTEFVKRQLRKGKSAISFDNLYYKPEKEDLDIESIQNIELKRNRTNV